jgi:hypothetical protein
MAARQPLTVNRIDKASGLLPRPTLTGLTGLTRLTTCVARGIGGLLCTHPLLSVLTELTTLTGLTTLTRLTVNPVNPVNAGGSNA